MRCPLTLLALMLALGSLCGCDDGGSGGKKDVGLAPPTAKDAGVAADAAATPCDVRLKPGGDEDEKVQRAIFEAAPGAIICLGEGVFNMTSELRIDRPALTLRGTGIGTVLDFTGQDVGGGGVHVRADGITLERLKISNPPADAIRATGVTGVTLRDLDIEWAAPSGSENGAYGFYAVGCQNVVVKTSIVRGASEAGLYLSQSSLALLEGNELTGNGVGIQVSNATEVEVALNAVEGNGAGIIVLEHPGLPLQGQGAIKVHSNRIGDNNLAGVAPAGSVAAILAGVGVALLGVDDAEVADNTITGHGTAGIALLSWHEALFGVPRDALFDGFPERNFVHDNVVSGNGGDPSGALEAIGLPTPAADLIWDGCARPDEEAGSCFDANGPGRDMPDPTFLNLQACDAGANPDADLEAVTCELELLGDVIPDEADCESIDCAADPWPEQPSKLSELSLFQGDLAELRPAERLFPFEVAAPMWFDGARAERFVYLPEGTSIDFAGDEDWDFPEGTVAVKNVYFADKIVETRLLILDGRWWPEVYVWNDTRTEALRRPTGQRVRVTFQDEQGRPEQGEYAVQPVVSCAACHGINGGEPWVLGLTTRQLSRLVERDDASVDQLDWLADRGFFRAALPDLGDREPGLVDPMDDDLDLEARARAYLDGNCSHCHRDEGSAAATGLILLASETDPARLGICKRPAAAGRGTGGRPFDIKPGNVVASVLPLRVGAIAPAVRMPEALSRIPHRAGGVLLEDWIRGMALDACE